MNLDLGGGTTKVTHCLDGEVVASGALDVGARLVTFGPDGTITTVEPVLHRLLVELDLIRDVAPGRPAIPGQLQLVAGHLIAAVVAYAGLAGGELRADLHRSSALPVPGGGLELSVTGGVSEYYYQRSTRDCGDLGPALALALRDALAATGSPQWEPPHGIRATVTGASRETTQLTGSTIHLNPDLLPLRNLPVARINGALADSHSGSNSGAFAMEVRDVVGRSREVPHAFVVPWVGRTTATMVDQAADLLSGALALRTAPSVVVVEADVAGLLGAALVERATPGAWMVIDGLEASDDTFLDIGQPLPWVDVVPVVVKTLLFSTSA